MIQSIIIFYLQFYFDYTLILWWCTLVLLHKSWHLVNLFPLPSICSFRRRGRVCNDFAVWAVSFLISGICACLYKKDFSSHYLIWFCDANRGRLFFHFFHFIMRNIFRDIFLIKLKKGNPIKNHWLQQRGEFLGQELYVLQVCHLRHFQVTP